MLAVGPEISPLPLSGGQLLLNPVDLIPITIDAAGQFSILDIQGGGGPQALVAQVGVFDANYPTGFSLSNAVRAVLLP